MKMSNPSCYGETQSLEHECMNIAQDGVFCILTSHIIYACAEVLQKLHPSNEVKPCRTYEYTDTYILNPMQRTFAKCNYIYVTPSCALVWRFIFTQGLHSFQTNKQNPAVTDSMLKLLQPSLGLLQYANVTLCQSLYALSRWSSYIFVQVLAAIVVQSFCFGQPELLHTAGPETLEALSTLLVTFALQKWNQWSTQQVTENGLHIKLACFIISTCSHEKITTTKTRQQRAQLACWSTSMIKFTVH